MTSHASVGAVGRHRGYLCAAEFGLKQLMLLCSEPIRILSRDAWPRRVANCFCLRRLPPPSVGIARGTAGYIGLWLVNNFAVDAALSMKS